jgi:hypothetical protein
MRIATGKLGRFWIGTALIVWNTIVVLVLFNVGLGLLYRAKDTYRARYTNRIFDSYPAHLSELLNLYPSMSKQQVNDLLRECWSRPYVYETFTEFGEAPYKGKYVNVSEHGYRLGTNQGPWPPRRGQHFVVFLFGGSTVFGYGVPDSLALGSRLQEMLGQKMGKDVRVYNFGQGYYYSTQERIFFEKLLTAGYVPDMAIFVDGTNEFFHTGIELAFKPQFADCDNAPCLLELSIAGIRALPMTKLAGRVRLLPTRGDTAMPDDKWQDSIYSRREPLQSVVDRYLRNKLMIKGVADAFGSRVVFVWQPLPYYKYDLRYDPFTERMGRLHRFAGYGYPMMKEVVEQHRADPLVWCADIQDGVHEPLYVDGVHYSPKMTGLVAGCIVDGIDASPPVKQARLAVSKTQRRIP